MKYRMFFRYYLCNLNSNKTMRKAGSFNLDVVYSMSFKFLTGKS